MICVAIMSCNNSTNIGTTKGIIMAKNIGMTVMGRTSALFSEQDEIQTVQDAYNKLGLSGSYTATVGGEPAEMSQELNDGEFVVFAKATKGGLV